MERLTLTEFRLKAYEVVWWTCESCGAIGPRVASHRFDRGVDELNVMYKTGGCCGRVTVRHIEDGGTPP